MTAASFVATLALFMAVAVAVLLAAWWIESGD
jgi:hypothetical protein